MLCELPTNPVRDASSLPDPMLDIEPSGLQEAVLAGGCFWCVEAVYGRLSGVGAVTPGYSGGAAETADYKSVCAGTTGHAEAVRIEFDSEQISYGQLLKVFFSVVHDPTQLNRQGNDVGPQYRSAVFYADDEQREVAAAYIRQLDTSGAFEAPIVTALEPLHAFYPAEAYHQAYADNNPDQPYIRAVARPKVEKLNKTFAERLKRED